MQWMCNTMDIRTAFLQGCDLRRDVFIKPPAGFAPVGVLWKLKKCTYGLVDAARHWYDRVKTEILNVGCIVSMYDPCLFYKKDSRGDVYGLIATHVDDFLWAGNVSFKCEVIDKLNEVFDVRSSQKTPFSYSGFEISQTDNCIRLDLSAYLSGVKEVSVDFLSADKFHMRDLRALLRKLQWIACQVRPDIAFAVSSLLSFAGQWQRCHFLAANKIVRKLKFSSDLCLIYQKFSNLSEHFSIDVLQMRHLVTFLVGVLKLVIWYSLISLDVNQLYSVGDLRSSDESFAVLYLQKLLPVVMESRQHLFAINWFSN